MAGKNLPRVCVCQGAPPVYCRKTALHPLTPARLQHVIANHVFATANTYPSSACHCVPRSCNREHLSVLCMSLRPCPAHTCQVSACPRAKRPCTRTHASSFSMSLRTSAHTGAAIRVPAGKRCKLVILRADSQHFSDSPKALLSVMPCRRRCGLPRRFAPRNDIQKFAACAHHKDALPGKPVTAYVFAQGATCFFASSAGPPCTGSQ